MYGVDKQQGFQNKIQNHNGCGKKDNFFEQGFFWFDRGKKFYSNQEVTKEKSAKCFYDVVQITSRNNIHPEVKIDVELKYF